MTKALDNSDNILKEKITLRIIELFEKSELNQTAFALEIESDKQNFSKILKGKRAGITTIHRICKVAGISLKDFFDSPLFEDL